MVKLLKSCLSYNIYEGVKENQKIYFKIWVFGDAPTLEEVENALRTAEIDKYSQFKTVKENIDNDIIAFFELRISSKELTPLNLSAYDYEVCYKKNLKPNNALRSTAIVQEEDYFYVACEPCDYQSSLNNKNLQTIFNYNFKDIENVINKKFSHIETY